MADPIRKIILRTLRRVFIWPLEASLVLLLFGLARLLPMPLASALFGGLFGLELYTQRTALQGDKGFVARTFGAASE